MIANWVHTISPKALVSVAPFYHFNQSDYDSLATDLPAATTWHQNSNYAGAQADGRVDVGWNSFSGGLYSFYQRENDLFGVPVNDGSGPSQPNTPANANAGLVEFYIGDHLRLGQYVTLLGGERFSIYRAGLDESAIYPRIGATVRIPKLNWVLRGFYGHFFQPAPILTVSSSVLNYAGSLRRRREHVYAAALGARRGAPVRHRDSLPGMDAGCGHVQESREQLSRPLEPRRIEYVLPHRRGWRAGARLGDDAALAAAVATTGSFT